MNYFLAIICIIIGIVIIIFTNKEGKDDKPSFTVYYIMHLKGYIGGVGAILLGLLMMLQAFGWWKVHEVMLQGKNKPDLIFRSGLFLFLFYSIKL